MYTHHCQQPAHAHVDGVRVATAALEVARVNIFRVSAIGSGILGLFTATNLGPTLTRPN